MHPAEPRKRSRRTHIGWLALVLLAAACGMRITASPAAPRQEGLAQAGSLLGPWDVGARRAAAGEAVPAFACQLPPAAQPRVSGRVFYLPGTGNAQADPVLRSADDALARPINDYVAFVMHTADDYMRSRPADPARAACVLAWLDAWAGAGALREASDQQGRYLRNWTQADLAIAFLTVRDEPSLDADRLGRVARWLEILGWAVNADFRDGHERNNHRDWAALSAVAAGAASGDRALYAWGIETATQALADIGPDGTIPLELARRDKALGYHAFALQARVLTAAIAARNGTDLWHAQGGALLRLANLLTCALLDPSLIAAKTGIAQDTHDLLGWPSRRALSWAEPVYAATGDRRLEPFLRRFRPGIGSIRNGGDMTLSFGTPLSGHD